MSRSTLFPFDDAMAFGFGHLHLSPVAFWAMTPRELRQAFKPHLAHITTAAMTRARLDDLMRAFPDHSGNRESDHARSLS